jgi:SRSO17 transposase
VTTDELHAAASQLTQLHQRFAPRFGRREAQEQSLVYLHGLLVGQGRKSAEPMALVFGEPDPDAGISQHQVLALQRFLTVSPWDAAAVQQEIQAVFAEQLVPATWQWPIGTVGVVDDAGFVKKGTASVGVARQYCGRVGKTANCQVGVFLVGVTPAGTALLDQQLYLPKTWAKARGRRNTTRVPKGVKFRTKPQIAVELLQRTRTAGHVSFDWVIADEGYGKIGSFLDALEDHQQRYVVEVPVNTTVWTVDPATCVPPPTGAGRPPCRPRRDAVRSVQALAASLPPAAWQALQLRQGAKGPLVFECARVRVWAVRHRQPGPPVWLVLRRALGPEAELQYYLSNADADTALEVLALVTGTRYRVEEFFEEGKSYLGMGHYEARAWTSWHHHLSLVGLAHLFVTLTRQRLKQSPQPDAGHGRAPAAERLAQIAAYRRRRHGQHGVSPGAQRNRAPIAC